VKDIVDVLKKNNIRVESDIRNEKIGYKIREAQMQKVPYMIIVGDKEMNERNISVRSRKNGDIGTMSLDDFTAKVKDEVRSKSNEN
jgi:threonyl-tRNA synthetase